MSQLINDTISGTVELTELPDRLSFQNWRDFLQTLPKLLSVRIPLGLSGVVFQAEEPSEDDRDKLWIRRDRSGSIVGLYLFQLGNWHPFYNLPPDQVIWSYGDSLNVREGFQLIDTDDELIAPEVVQAIKGQYIPNGSGGYGYFAVRYKGFE